MLPFFNGLNVFGHVVGHKLMQFVCHAWVSLVGGDAIDRALEMARLVDVGQAFFTGKR